uniref:Cation/H(+) antiporter 20 n=1 Tax=Tanacetum cinerariifolium TaxID=118510 RepID=A0A6L2MTG4_TANCI|nr:cation/H(+) antiporter 20 [Tanacetum cinerariifolium]
MSSSYDNFVETLLYGKKSLTLKDVLSCLNSRELKKMTYAKDGGDGLYVRGRSDYRGNQGRGSSQSKSKEVNWIYQKTARQGSGMPSEGYDNGDLLMASMCHMGTEKVRVQIKDGLSFVLENVRYILELKINLISLGTLDREGYTVKLQNDRVKVINGSLMVLSGTIKENYLYSLDGWAESGEASVGRKLKKLRADNGLEFCNHDLNKLCKERDIARHLKVARTPQQNALAERMNMTLLNKVRCLLIQSGLPDLFWAEATMTAAYMINRSPSTTLEKQKPMDLWSGHPANYEMLRIFNSKKKVEFELKLQGSRVEPTVDPHTREYPGNEDEEQDEGPQQSNLDNYVLVRDRAKRITTIPARYRDEGNVSLSRPSGSRVEDDMTAYAFAIGRDEFFKEESYLGAGRSTTWLELGGLQEQIDYNEIFSPVVRHTSIRVILSLTACEDYELEQFDVKTEFLHGNLEETIYMRQPPGFEEGTSNKMIGWLLVKASLGSNILRNCYEKEFDLKELGPTRKILGMEIVRGRGSRTLKVSQPGYVQKILNNYRVYNEKSVYVPLGAHFKVSLKDCPSRDWDVERMSKVPYANVVGIVYGRDQGKHVDVHGFVDADYAKDPYKGCAFVIFMMVVIKPAMAWVAHRCLPEHNTVDEAYICLSLATVMVFGFITDFIGIHSIFGAFVFGLTIPKGDFAEKLIQRIEDFVSGLLLPLYFASSGLKTDVTKISGGKGWGLLAMVITAACGGKILGTFVVAVMCMMSVRESITLGLLMNTKGLVELIVLNIGKEKKVLNDVAFAILVLMALFTTFITTPAVMALYKPARRSGSAGSSSSKKYDLCLLACAHGPGNISSLINLIESTHSVNKSQLKLYIMHLVELTERSSSIVMVQRVRKNGLPFVSRFNYKVRAFHERVAVAFRAYGQMGNVVIRTMTAISALSTMHEDICHVAKEKNVPMIILPFHKRWIKTDAILVDRGLGDESQQNLGSVTTVAHKACVMFFGGPDDHECLELTGRMVEHPAVNVTVLRFVEGIRVEHDGVGLRPAPSNGTEKYTFSTAIDNPAKEKERDEKAIDDFQEKWEGMVEYKEIKGTNVVESILAIGKSGEYELIVVGKARFPTVMVARLADRQPEHAELGPVGDLLASSNHGIVSSVLVIQHDKEQLEDVSVSVATQNEEAANEEV